MDEIDVKAHNKSVQDEEIDWEGKETLSDFMRNQLIEFAEFLLCDYDITKEGDNLVFNLCGTLQNYNEKEIVDRYLDKDNLHQR